MISTIVAAINTTGSKGLNRRQRVKSVFLTLIAIRQNVTVGDDFHIGPGSIVWAPRRLDIGRDVYIGKNVTVEVDGTIGDGVLIANMVGIVGRRDHDHTEVGASIRRSRWVGDFPKELSLKTVIGSDVWLGYGTVVLSGVTIGDTSIVAAGAVVTSDVPPNSIVAGNPARIVRKRFSDADLDKHWEKLERNGHRLLIGKRSNS